MNGNRLGSRIGPTVYNIILTRSMKDVHLGQSFTIHRNFHPFRACLSTYCDCPHGNNLTRVTYILGAPQERPGPSF